MAQISIRKQFNDKPAGGRVPSKRVQAGKETVADVARLREQQHRRFKIYERVKAKEERAGLNSWRVQLRQSFHLLYLEAN